MPDPIPSDTPPDESKIKPGFDPHEYEAEKAVANPDTEVPIQMRMYHDVIATTKKRMEDLKNILREKVKHTELYDFPERQEDDKARLEGDEKENNYLWLEKSKIVPVAINSLGNSKITIKEIILPGKGHMSHPILQDKLPEDESFVVIRFTLYDNKEIDMWSLSDEFSPRWQSLDGTLGITLASNYLLLINSEMPPTIIQERSWDKQNYSWSEKLATYRHHRITDEECAAILEAIATAPL